MLTTVQTLGALRLPPQRPDFLSTRRPPDGACPVPAATLANWPVGGWHDSSLDLLRGLEVRDLGPVDALFDLVAVR